MGNDAARGEKGSREECKGELTIFGTGSRLFKMDPTSASLDRPLTQ